VQRRPVGPARAAELADAAAAAGDLDALCEALVERANETGGPDNITVVAARFDGPALPPPDAADDEVGHRQFAVLPTPGAAQALVADVLAGGAPAVVVAPPPATPAAPPRADGGVAGGSPPFGVPAPSLAADDDEDLDERRGRARLVYLALAILAASVAAYYLWRLLSA
jgi:protein phosphatase